MFNPRFIKIFIAVLVIGIFISGVSFVSAQDQSTGSANPGMDLFQPTEQTNTTPNIRPSGSTDNTAGSNIFSPDSQPTGSPAVVTPLNDNAAPSQSIAASAATNPQQGQPDNSPGLIINVLTFISAKVLTFLSGFIADIIAFGNQVITLPIVVLGFQTVLGIANLGFVLAIIVIAFATMFRLQSYAMKQTLWKLVVAALLVNFSLVIAGAFISVSNVFVNYFMSGFNGDLGTTLANALNPNALASVTGTSGLFETLVSPFKTFFATFASSIFILVFTIAIIITFAALAVMLLIRAISLAMLLIMMPLVWLAWIFPYTAGHWKKWWEQFLRWTFFAPIVLFFIYIIVSSMGKVGDFNAAALGQSSSVSSGASAGQNSSGSSANLNNAALATQTQISGGTTNQAFSDGLSLPSNFLGYASQLIIMLGLLMGGLMMANSFGTSLGGAAYGMAKGVGGKFGKWTGRKTWQGAAYPFRRRGAATGAQSLAEKTQGWAEGRKSKLGRFAAGWLSRGVTGLAEKGGVDELKHQKENIKNMSKEQVKASLLTAISKPRQIALLEKLSDQKSLDEVDASRYLNNSTQKAFNSYGEGRAFGDIEKSFGMNVEMMNAIKSGKNDDIVAATEKFVSRLSKSDINKSYIKEMFGDKAKFGFDQTTLKNMGIIISDALAKSNPALVASVIPKLDSGQRDTFKKNYKDSIWKVRQLDGNRAKEIEERFKKIIDNYEYGRESEKEELSAPTTT